jgi:hypothetical protein
METPIALAGYDSKKLSVLYHVFVAKGYAPWFLWDATYDPVPDTLPTARVITFSAHLFAPECQLLASRRILDRLNVDNVWIIWTDAFAVKSIPDLVDLDSRKDDIIAGRGCSRMSRKSLERIARDFGSDIDWDGIDIFTVD